MPGEHSHEDEIVSDDTAFLIGTAILIGFVVMLLIDESTTMMISPSGGCEQKEIKSADNHEMEPLIN